MSWRAVSSALNHPFTGINNSGGACSINSNSGGKVVIAFTPQAPLS
jgi:hypothetical protein